MQGAVAGEVCVVKLYDTRRNESISAYFPEKRCLQALQTRASVVRFMVCRMDSISGIASQQSVGCPISCSQEGIGHHAVGVCHGDIRLSNIFLALDGSCRLADFAHCVQGASQDQMKREHLELSKLRHMVKW